MSPIPLARFNQIEMSLGDGLCICLETVSRQALRRGPPRARRSRELGVLYGGGLNWRAEIVVLARPPSQKTGGPFSPQ